jgi:hypothetical protein
LIKRYNDVSGGRVDRIEWYTVLACYKLGILLEGTFARSCAGKAPKGAGARLHSGAVALFARAARLLTDS